MARLRRGQGAQRDLPGHSPDLAARPHPRSRMRGRRRRPPMGAARRRFVLPPRHPRPSRPCSSCPGGHGSPYRIRSKNGARQPRPPRRALPTRRPRLIRRLRSRPDPVRARTRTCVAHLTSVLMPSTPFAYPQVISRTYALRCPNSAISGGLCRETAVRNARLIDPIQTFMVCPHADRFRPFSSVAGRSLSRVPTDSARRPSRA